MKPEMRIFIRAFLDGFTGAGFWGKLDIPGMPKQIFASDPSETIHANGESEETCRRLLKSQKNDTQSS